MTTVLKKRNLVLQAKAKAKREGRAGE